jgi:phage terminase large subunit GpA-like protein
MPRGRPVQTGLPQDLPVVSDCEKIAAIVSAFYTALALSEDLDLETWGELYRKLPRESSAEYGDWSLRRFPFLKKIARVLNPKSNAVEIVVMKGAQLGFTELVITWLLYIADVYPSPCIYTQNTDDAVKDFVKQKWKPSVKACEKLLYILGENKPNYLSRSWDNHGYPGGFIAMGGASGSSDFIRSKSVRYAAVDEEDTYKLNVSDQGSPIGLIRKRQQTFSDKKMFRLSTPTLEETSTIKPAFLAGSQEYFYVPCPHCGDFFVIKWEQIKYSKKLDTSGLPVEIFLECPSCADKIIEVDHKDYMLDNGDWFSTKNPENSEEPLERYKVGDVEFPSFHLSSFYSPVGQFSWRDAIREWFEYTATNDIEKLKVIINQTWGETFADEGREISTNYLVQRREQYSHEVPEGCLVLTAGIDIQDDRIEVEVVGWGMFEENWSIDYTIIYGDTSQLGDAQSLLPDGQPTVWKLLDDYLLTKFEHPSGYKLPIECTMIDSHYKTEEVNIFCKQRESRRVYPICGIEGWSKGLWSCNKSRHERYGTLQYRAHGYELKNKIYAMLKIDTVGPAYCHFPTRDIYSEAHFYGLTCEYRESRITGGRLKLVWVNKTGARNEPLDCRQYAYCAFLAYPVNLSHRLKNGFVEQKTRRVRVKKYGSNGL